MVGVLIPGYTGEAVETKDPVTTKPLTFSGPGKCAQPRVYYGNTDPYQQSNPTSQARARLNAGAQEPS